jgi:pyruvate kinase
MAPMEQTPATRPSNTKIVATVGPACDGFERLSELLAAGVDVFRLNMAHGKPAEQEVRLEAIRRASRELNQPVAVLVDLAGPKIRLGELPDGALTLDADERVRFVRASSGQTAEGRPDADEGPPELTTTYAPLLDELHAGDRVMLADGIVSLRVVRVTGEYAECEVVQPGQVRSRQGVNLPGVKLSAPALGPEDRENAVWAARSGIDFLGLSFVRSPVEVRELKSLLAEHGSEAQVVAKIEKPEALERLEEIIEAADVVMVARGDLGVEIDIARVAVAQKEIIAACGRHRKPAIIATQMLDSMQNSRLPTRAEVTDVANAILDGADACMLSGETAIGKYPREAVAMMHRIALATEPLCRRQPRPAPPDFTAENVHAITEATVLAAGRLADALGAKLVVVATASGATALSLAKNRNFVPAVGVSRSDATLRRMCLYWGVIPLAGAPVDDGTALLKHVAGRGREHGFLASGDRVVLIAGTGLRTTRHNMIVVHTIDG